MDRNVTTNQRHVHKVQSFLSSVPWTIFYNGSQVFSYYKKDILRSAACISSSSLHCFYKKIHSQITRGGSTKFLVKMSMYRYFRQRVPFVIFFFLPIVIRCIHGIRLFLSLFSRFMTWHLFF